MELKENRKTGKASGEVYEIGEKLVAYAESVVKLSEEILKNYTTGGIPPEGPSVDESSREFPVYFGGLRRQLYTVHRCLDRIKEMLELSEL